MALKIKINLLLVSLVCTLGCGVLQDLAESGSNQAVPTPTATAFPLIVRAVEFPQRVEIQGDATDGWVYLYCQDCSMPKDWEIFEHVSFSVVEADDFTAFDFDPRPWIEMVSASEIRFAFNIRCGTPQQVTLEVMVSNAVGEQSNPYAFSFTCE
ncbi:MAG: hypothetical protein JXB38_01780 [Anaerolineales bacterium]|nr:hypothetical protein [Anaerolineales bacterium]